MHRGLMVYSTCHLASSPKLYIIQEPDGRTRARLATVTRPTCLCINRLYGVYISIFYVIYAKKPQSPYKELESQVETRRRISRAFFVTFLPSHSSLRNIARVCVSGIMHLRHIIYRIPSILRYYICTARCEGVLIIFRCKRIIYYSM